MFKLRIYCNDRDCQYWEDGIGTYETYDKALIMCYENALEETESLMESGNFFNWFEVNRNFEITEAYENEALKDTTFFLLQLFIMTKLRGIEKMIVVSKSLLGTIL